MLILVSYDVSTKDVAGKRRLRRVAKLCQSHGIRVQLSVFECELDPGQWADMKGRLLEIISEEKDNIRFYYLGSNWDRRVEQHGVGEITRQFEDPLIL